MIGLTDDALRLVDAALAEDVGAADWTTLWTVPPDARAQAVIVAKAPGVVAGLALVRATFHRLDHELELDARLDDGALVRPGDRIATLAGRAHAILTGERTALNFLQRLSGVATLARRYAEAVAGTGARILDTRKTTPGWRQLEKAAVRAGGADNHRHGLFDMVLIKENHIAAAGGITEAVRRVRERNAAGLAVEVEVRSRAELDVALAAGVDRLLLDNMDLDTMRAAVRRVREATATGGTEIEASGNMTLDRVRAVAETGVDFISVGAITHSAPALDLSLLIRIP